MANQHEFSDTPKAHAAQAAQEGVITVLDLSLLTGVEPNVLNGMARKGELQSYSEYHGKRFFKFEEIIRWIGESEADSAAKGMLRGAIEAEMKQPDCPYVIETVSEGDRTRYSLCWKAYAQAA